MVICDGIIMKRERERERERNRPRGGGRGTHPYNSFATAAPIGRARRVLSCALPPLLPLVHAHVRGSLSRREPSRSLLAPEVIMRKWTKCLRHVGQQCLCFSVSNVDRYDDRALELYIYFFSGCFDSFEQKRKFWRAFLLLMLNATCSARHSRVGDGIQFF